MTAGTDFEALAGATAQTSRRTVGTAIDMGQGGEAASAHLGHSKTDVTYEHYVGRARQRDGHSAPLEAFNPDNGLQILDQKVGDDWD